MRASDNGKRENALVFPAESKPSIRMRISLLPKSFFNAAPIASVLGALLSLEREMGGKAERS